MNRLYLDIETLPTDDEAVKAEIAASIPPPGNISKADTIAAWEAEKKPALVAEAIAKTSFNGAHGRVCCVGWAWNDDEPYSVDLRHGGEKEMLSKFVNELLPSLPSHIPMRGSIYIEEAICIVGHYVAEFDLRFLWQRSFVLGVRMPLFFPRDPKPWSKEVHDTMQMWAGAKGSISLDNLCKALGVPGKDGIDGSMVAGMWAEGKHDEVAAYCRDDVERVRAAHKKMLVAYGETE